MNGGGGSSGMIFGQFEPVVVWLTGKINKLLCLVPV